MTRRFKLTANQRAANVARTGLRFNLATGA